MEAKELSIFTPQQIYSFIEIALQSTTEQELPRSADLSPHQALGLQSEVDQKPTTNPSD